jgi:hypothetical protein
MEIDPIAVLEINAFNLWQLAATARLSERTGLYDEICNPRPGDLVLEVTSICFARAKGSRLGRLLRIVQEPFPSSDNPDSNVYGMTEPAHYIELPDGREQRWTNARFIKVITDIVR